ncbi:MAG TPA: histone deacetylase family protein [Dehalococcoidia bacterium]|jgi:acetoin utilization protein AcuC|nr:histone deacetylase family protein [Dehalococcoidia bacterium]
MSIAILYREELKEYDFGPGHPFHGERYELFPRFLRQNLAEDDNYRILKSDWASDEDLLLICQKDYINFTRDCYRALNLGLSYSGQFPRFHSGDNIPVGKPGKLEEAARLIIGQAKMACQLVQEGRFEKVVSIGGGLHHAKPAYGEGFCLYNDVAFCAMNLIDKYNLDRILILDTDAHAGNGTSEYFYRDQRVLFIDLHQDPRTLYPGTGFAHQIGLDSGEGFTINIPMPVYAGYDSYQSVLDEIVYPVVEEFKPQIIIRNGGSDPHFNDGLTNLGLPVKGFRMIGEEVREMAKICDGKVIDLIASGYNKEVLPYGWLALISGLAGINIIVEEPEPIPQRFKEDSSLPETKKVIEEVKKYHQDYWRCFN